MLVGDTRGPSSSLLPSLRPGLAAGTLNTWGQVHVCFSLCRSVLFPAFRSQGGQPQEGRSDVSHLPWGHSARACHLGHTTQTLCLCTASSF